MVLDELSVGARAAMLAWSACALGAFGCDREIERPGQLIVAIDTDMAIPQQVDTLHVQVEIGGQIEYHRPFEVGPRSPDLLPATLTLYDEDDPRRDPVTVKIAGSKAGPNGLEWRTYREATMPIPRGRMATLRMPVQWLCKGTAEAVPSGDDPFEKPSAQSTCGTGFTCRAGRCEESEVEEPLLPDYKPQDVFGGGATPEQGSCFDTVGCMATGRSVTPDENCQIDLPSEEHFNVALRVVSDGICDASGVNCFVPLDGRNPEGWMIADERVQLPPAVCEKMESGLIRAVLVSDSCEIKTAGVPACGPWSSVTKGRKGQYRPDAPVKPSATLLTTLPTDADATRCCPLMAADDKLYACVCSGTSSATVFEVDPAEGTTRRVGTLNPQNIREPLAASVFEGSLYWAAGREVRRTPLGESDALASSFGVPAPAALYETGSLLADSTHIYALASGGAGDGEASVQLFSILRDRTSAPVSIPAGDVPVFQFDHDDAAVYLALDRDEDTDSGLRRTSSVVRIEKQSGLRQVLMAERTLELTTSERGGYVGVRVDDGIVYALYEAVDAEGQFHVQLHTLRANASSTDPQTMFEMPIDPGHTRLRLLGVAGGGVLVSRFELEDGRVANSSLLAIPASGGEPRILADFANDHPADGIGKTGTHVYWLNASGAVYALPRSLLE